METMMTEVYYRFEDQQYAALLDEHENPIGDGVVEIQLVTFPVISRTEKGVWIDTRGRTRSHRRWIGDAHTKKFATACLETALASFKERKKSQRRIYTSRLRVLDKLDKMVERIDTTARTGFIDLTK